MIKYIQSSLAYGVLVVGVLLISVIGAIYSLFCSQKEMVRYLHKSFKNVRQLLYKILNIQLIYRGVENLPKEPCIFASKHQSALETSFFFNTVKEKTVYAYKKEINKVPLWKYLSSKFGGVPIDRKTRGAKVLINLLRKTKSEYKNGYSMVIFPEGTRVLPNKYVKIQTGVYQLYKHLNIPIVPVALNSGAIFPSGSKILHRNKKLIIQFAPAIPKGLSEEEFFQYLHNHMIKKSDELYLEANI